MGVYVNPGNEGFQRVVSGEYIDKTGAISLINSVIGTPMGLVLRHAPPPVRQDVCGGVAGGLLQLRLRLAHAL